jgi:hypothetical protein
MTAEDSEEEAYWYDRLAKQQLHSEVEETAAAAEAASDVDGGDDDDDYNDVSNGGDDDGGDDDGGASSAASAAEVAAGTKTPSLLLTIQVRSVYFCFCVSFSHVCFHHFVHSVNTIAYVNPYPLLVLAVFQTLTFLLTIQDARDVATAVNRLGYHYALPAFAINHSLSFVPFVLFIPH